MENRNVTIFLISALFTLVNQQNPMIIGKTGGEYIFLPKFSKRYDFGCIQQEHPIRVRKQT
jgi:hypothetical protein